MGDGHEGSYGDCDDHYAAALFLPSLLRFFTEPTFIDYFDV